MKITASDNKNWSAINIKITTFHNKAHEKNGLECNTYMQLFHILNTLLTTKNGNDAKKILEELLVFKTVPENWEHDADMSWTALP